MQKDLYLGVIEMYEPESLRYKELFQLIESSLDVLYSSSISQDKSEAIRACFDIISERIMKSNRFVYVAVEHCKVCFWIKVEKTFLVDNLNKIMDAGILFFVSDQGDAFRIYIGEYMVELLNNSTQ